MRLGVSIQESYILRKVLYSQLVDGAVADQADDARLASLVCLIGRAETTA